ncbi:hypothetical protein N199_06525 [Helicobacter pylori UM038]|uniref:Uncharacterized protein n=1 Tax=Helicobacter pylori UM038 TaxID=1352343 RepID=A0AAV3JR31_HELPX|nr:hypothetical protein N199_06525 [Helicobacter pylori UM038]
MFGLEYLMFGLGVGFYKYLLRACYKASCFYYKRKHSKNFWQKLL